MIALNELATQAPETSLDEVGATDSKTTARGRQRLQHGAERIEIDDRVTLFRTSRSPKWYLQYMWEGRQCRPSLKTTSKKWALNLARKKAAELVLGVADSPARRSATLDQGITKYLAALADQNKDPKTLEIYTRDLRQFESYCLEHGVKRLDGLSTDLLENYHRLLATTGYKPPTRPGAKENGRSFKKRPLSPKTVNSKMKTIRQMMKAVLKRGMAKVDPAAAYHLPAAPKKKATCWDGPTLVAILAHADPDVKDLIDFLRLSGLRANELCWLLRDDYQRDDIAKVLIRSKECPQTGRKWRPKHGHSRVVPLGPDAVAIAERAAAASAAAGVPWLFNASGTGRKQMGRWQSGRLWRLVKKAMKAAGVKAGTTHTLRHCFCSHLCASGVQPFDVMELMGHSALDIVLGYTHPTEQALSRAVCGVSFAKMLEGGSSSGPGQTAGKEESKSSEFSANAAEAAED